MKKLKIMSLAFALIMVLNMFTLSLFAEDAPPAEPLDTPTAKIDVTQTDNYAPVVWDEVTNPEGLPYGKWKAGTGTVTYLSDLEFVESNTNNGSATAKDGPYKNSGQGITIAQTMKYEKGLGTHPVAPNSDKIAFTTIDIWEYTNPDGQYKYDTFHSVVGLTNIASAGVYFSVYGDKDDGNGLVKLGCSELITLANIGEFNIDITGVHKLTLYVTVPVDGSNSSSASAFADACIFKADPNAVKPDYTVKDDAGDNGNDNAGDNTGNNGGELVTPETKAPETKAPETQAPTSDTQAAEEGGCGGVIGAGLAVVSAVALCGAVATKKRRK